MMWLALLLAPLVGAVPQAQHTLSNDAVTASFSTSGLIALGPAAAGASQEREQEVAVAVAGDNFELHLLLVPNTRGYCKPVCVLDSASAAAPPVMQPGANATSVAYRFQATCARHCHVYSAHKSRLLLPRVAA